MIREAIRQQAIVKKGGRIEIFSPELPVGATVEVIVLFDPPSPDIKKEFQLHSSDDDKPHIKEINDEV